jgi:hypothetical protein
MAQQRPKQLDSPLLPKIFKVEGKAHVWEYRRTGAKVGANRLIGADVVIVASQGYAVVWTDREIPLVVQQPR